MILPLMRVSVTFFASRHSSHFVRSSCASWRHTASLNGPFVTMWLGSVHLSPHWSIAFLLTARNEWCAACWTNHGCSPVSVTLSVLSSTASTPILSARASQSCFLASHELYSVAPWIPYSWYA